MAKNRIKKKRNKQYRGEDAAPSQPASVTKVSVPKRSKLGKWWYENRKSVARRLGFVGFATLLYGIFTLIF